MSLLLRAGDWTQVTPDSAGWRYLFFGVRPAPFESETRGVEIALVPLSGRCRVEADGRFTILMPHPERVFRSVQMSWHPRGWGEDSPWMRMFRNARTWIG